MSDDKIRVGFALTGSYCTYEAVFPEIERLVAEGYEVIPIMSETASVTDSRFGSAEEFIDRLEKTTGNDVLCSIREVEPIGPQKLLDALVIAPCTGNTIAKLANGIADTCVTMAAKAHLRNERPVVIGVSTNDALSNGAKNIGMLLNAKNVYFVPMGQDDAFNKPRSVVAHMEYIGDTVYHALRGEQIAPILM